MQGKSLFWWVYLLFFFKARSAPRTEEKCISVGKAPFAGWPERGLGSGWHLAAEAVIWGDGPSKKLVLG